MRKIVLSMVVAVALMAALAPPVRAWNLVEMACKELHIEHFCDLFQHGQGEGWW